MHLRLHYPSCFSLTYSGHFETHIIETVMKIENPDETTWREANRTNWNERVPLHLGAESYDLMALRAGRGKLHAIEESELGSVEGLRVLHLQCHFGRDTLTLAQRGAAVVGVDFSPPAIAAARQLTVELKLGHRVSFVESDLYDAPNALPEPASFDLVYVSWGALCWLPDMKRWAQVVAHFLKPGGRLYIVDGHPAALVFDDMTGTPGGMPGLFAPYLGRSSIVVDCDKDYASKELLKNVRTYEWIHPLSDIINGLIESGMQLEWLREHDTIAWKLFEQLVSDDNEMYRWPDKPWLPLSFSLHCRRR